MLDDSDSFRIIAAEVANNFVQATWPAALIYIRESGFTAAEILVAVFLGRDSNLQIRSGRVTVGIKT